MARIAIFGAGHNALICGAILADMGHEVEIFEKSGRAGGALLNYIFECGCTVSMAANTLRMLDGEVISMLRRGRGDVGKYELWRTPQLQSIFRVEGKSIPLYVGNVETLAKELELKTGENAANTRRFLVDVDNAAMAVAHLWTDPAATRWHFQSCLQALSGGLYTSFVSNSIAKTAAEYFDSDIAKQLLIGTNALVTDNFDNPGTAFSLLYLGGANIDGVAGYALPVGGMGGFASALVDVCQQVGVRIKLGRTLKSFACHERQIGRADLSDGTRVEADAYVCGFSPAIMRQLFRPLPSTHVPKQNDHVYETGAVRLIGHIPVELGRDLFTDLDGSAVAQQIISPGFSTFSQMAANAAQGAPSAVPYVEILSTASSFPNDSCGRHFPLSIYALYFPYSWCCELNRDDLRESVVTRIRQSIATALPWLARALEVDAVYTPLDFERLFGMHRGDVDHGSFAHGNIFEGRGGGGLPHGRTQFGNLYNCSSGIFPGGLVTGRPGIVAAKTILGMIGK